MNLKALWMQSNWQTRAPPKKSLKTSNPHPKACLFSIIFLGGPLADTAITVSDNDDEVPIASLLAEPAGHDGSDNETSP